MKKQLFTWIGTWLLVLQGLSGSAQDICNTVLRPQIESDNQISTQARAYMKVNAELEYERLKRMSSGARSADVWYKYFKGEFESSESSSEFREKIEKRFSQEGFTMQMADAKSRYRENISDEQIKAWEGCVGESKFLLTTRLKDKQSSVLRASWRPPEGGTPHTLRLEIKGGLIRGKNDLLIEFPGAASISLPVELATNSNRILVIGNIGPSATARGNPKGKSDSIEIVFEDESADKIIAIDLNRYNDYWTKEGDVIKYLPAHDGMKTAYMHRELTSHGMWTANGGGAFHVGWVVNVPEAGLYQIWIEYATTERRPMEVRLGESDSAPVQYIGLQQTTPNSTTPVWFPDGGVNLVKGKNHLWFHSTTRPPNINAVRLIKRSRF